MTARNSANTLLQMSRQGYSHTYTSVLTANTGMLFTCGKQITQTSANTDSDYTDIYGSCLDVM